MLDTDGSLLREKVQLTRLRPAQPAHTWRVATLKEGLPVDVYSSDIWWQGYLRCHSAATAESAGVWRVFCHHTNDEVAVDVAAWEAQLDGARPADGAIRPGLFWRDGSWFHRPGSDGQGGGQLADAAISGFEPMRQSRPVRRQLVADAPPEGVDLDSGDPAARPLLTPAALKALFLSFRQLQALLDAPDNDAATLCRIVPGALVRSFNDAECPHASRLWLVASASVSDTTGGLASIELCEAGSAEIITASALCNTAPTGLDVAAFLNSPAYTDLTLGGCRETAARLAAAQGMCANAARAVLQPADAAAQSALAAHYAAMATPAFDSAVSSHDTTGANGAPSQRALSAAALLLRPCTFHRCRKVPAALALPRYCYYPPPPAERVPSGPFCVACLSQWSKQMHDDFGLWPEGGGPPPCVSYGRVMRDARAAAAIP